MLRRSSATSSDPTVVDCSVLIVSYNNPDDLARLLQSLDTAAGDLSVAVTVVDNASTCDVGPIVAAHPGVGLIRSAANLGYSGGVNLAAREAPRGRCVLVLNPDVVVTAGSLEALTEAALRYGAAVPVIRGFDGRREWSLRHEPSVLRALGEALLGDHLPGRPAWLSEIERGSQAYLADRSVDWATGAAVMVSEAAGDAVGEWDAQRFFLYSEETDYCRRLREAGYAVRFVAGAEVVHRGGGSGSSPDLAALLAVNRVRYYRKWHGRPATAVFAVVVVVQHLLRAARAGDRRALAVLTSKRRRGTLPGAATAPR